MVYTFYHSLHIPMQRTVHLQVQQLRTIVKIIEPTVWFKQQTWRGWRRVRTASIYLTSHRNNCGPCMYNSSKISTRTFCPEIARPLIFNSHLTVSSPFNDIVLLCTGWLGIFFIATHIIVWHGFTDHMVNLCNCIIIVITMFSLTHFCSIHQLFIWFSSI